MKSIRLSPDIGSKAKPYRLLIKQAKTIINDIVVKGQIGYFLILGLRRKFLKMHYI
jgi:hypothetical protein